MAVNKVSFGNSTLIDLTGDTIAADKVLQGYIGHDAAGSMFVGRYKPTSDTGPYVWAVYDGDINAYAGQTVTTATNASGWY
ncbi:MAG: hypothetical protein KH354_03590, partial [Clostridiales bacterium]|nr:hypothetical protein [Clostridiales bacterium]